MKIITSALITLIAAAAFATDHAAPTAGTTATPTVATAEEMATKCKDPAHKDTKECKDMAKKAPAKKTK